MKPREYFISGLLLFTAVFLYFFHLSWGAPYFFHPDERNIAYSVSGLLFPSQLNPHFFAYGSLPIYAIYLTGIIKNLFHFSFSLSLPDAIIASRLLSSFLTLSTVILLFFVGKKMHSSTAGLLTSFFGIFSVGFIQFAHFGTFEMWLTFFYLLLFYRFLFFLEKKTIKNFSLLVVISSILIAIKISSLILLIFPFIAGILLLRESKAKIRFLAIKLSLLSLVMLSAILFISNPYAVLDFASFSLSIHYESSVATGTFPVFYTGGFFHTTPILYQLLHVYPFLLNPVLLCVGIVSLIGIGLRKKATAASYRYLLTFFLVYFFSQAFLFVKWTRYLIPTLPFIYLSLSFFLLDLKKILHISLQGFLWSLLLILCLVSSILWSSSYLLTVFVRPDTRVTAAAWAKNHLPRNSHVLTEAYDLGTLPFETNFPRLTTFNFYDLDANSSAKYELGYHISGADYLILPSQRLLKNRLTNPHNFPQGNIFYARVNKDKQFEKVYETPCDIFCYITYLGDPIYRYEETASVFDRPTVMIYRIHKK